MRRALFLMAALGLASLASNRASAASCACEHYGSQYDGICEAWPQTGSETYTWYTVGAATLPFPPDPHSGVAVYNCQPGKACALKVKVRLANGSSSTVTCALGTGGE